MSPGGRCLLFRHAREKLFFGVVGEAACCVDVSVGVGGGACLFGSHQV